LKKIDTKEEREQLRRNGIFLDGYFEAQYTQQGVRWGEVMVIVAVYLVWLTLAIYFEKPISLFIGFMVLAVIWPVIDRLCYMRYALRRKKFFLSQDDIYINWVTVVQIDEKYQHISYMEDDVFQPFGEAYIVDYVATLNDCQSVFKGERLLIVHVQDKKGKKYSLLMIPKRNFNLYREKQKCNSVNVIGIKHVPHVNAFYMKNLTALEGQEEEVICHSKWILFNKTINAATFHLGNMNRKHPTMEFVYEWNGEAYELKGYEVLRTYQCEYGDILLKKRGKLTKQVYFVPKQRT